MPDDDPPGNSPAAAADNRIGAAAADLIAARLDLAPGAGPGVAPCDRPSARRAIACRSRTGGGSTSRTFAVTTRTGEFVVKTNADVSVLARAGHNLSVLHNLGIRVPSAVAYDASRAHVAVSVLVMTKLRGRDLGLDRLAEQITDIQRKVASLPSNSGCGFVGIGELATRTWADLSSPIWKRLGRHVSSTT